MIPLSSRKLPVFLLALFVAVPMLASPRRRIIGIEPAFPPCALVTGTPAVTFTHDEGATLAPVLERLQGISYTFGLVALDTPSTLLAIHGTTLLRSTDAGCSWSVVDTVTFDNFYAPSLVAAKGDIAYIWSDNRTYLARYTSSGIVTLKPAPAAVVGVAVESGNGNHVRIGGADGRIYDTTDAGANWTRIGQLITGAPSTLFYRFAFDRKDLSHVVAGTTSGAWVSRDGGKNWIAATGLSSGGANVFNVVISPADSRVVWAQGINLPESDTHASSQGRHIYRSTDRGLTYASVVDQGANVQLINGPLMVPHPTDPNALYFVFSSIFQDYGTDLFRLDTSTSTPRLTVQHNAYDGIDAILFSPLDPTLMYLGLSSERGGL